MPPDYVLPEDLGLQGYAVRSTDFCISEFNSTIRLKQDEERTILENVFITGDRDGTNEFLTNARLWVTGPVYMPLMKLLQVKFVVDNEAGKILGKAAVPQPRDAEGALLEGRILTDGGLAPDAITGEVEPIRLSGWYGKNYLTPMLTGPLNTVFPICRDPKIRFKGCVEFRFTLHDPTGIYVTPYKVSLL